MYSVKLSDVIFDKNSKILGMPIVTTANKRIGIVENMILNEYGAIKYVIVRINKEMLIRLKAKDLRLSDNKIILERPIINRILDIMGELNMSYLRLIDILRRIRNGDDNCIDEMNIIKIHLKRALDIMEKVLNINHPEN